MKRFFPLVIAVLAGWPAAAFPADETIPLDGRWRFQLDRADAGVRENWAAKKLPGQIHLPGSLPALDVGGAAWFQRDFTIPKTWTGRRVALALEWAHGETRAWVDGEISGTNNSPSTPHEYDFGPLAPGRHTLTLRAAGDNFDGLLGDLSLRATPLVWIQDLQVCPHVATRSVTVTGSVGSAPGLSGQNGMVFYVDGKLLQSVVVNWGTN
ncbi:MAG TPA: hypothetical protein VGI63_08790, partial [Verrucomicrobiae bacterium]